MATTICVPIDSEIIGEMYLRWGPKADIRELIEHFLTFDLDHLADDGNFSPAYYAYRESQSTTEDFEAQFGPPHEGYHWAPLFLPNGTSICMEYKKEKHYATVKFGKIDFNGESYSPSEFARVVANGTNRNAWRDLLIKKPGDEQWMLADHLRRRR